MPGLPTPMQMAVFKRNNIITNIEWMKSRHEDEIALGLDTTLTSAQHLQLLQYIQALRVCMNGMTDPTKVVWPVAPSFIPVT